jgi:putative ABC transport system substrate-binding protein
MRRREVLRGGVGVLAAASAASAQTPGRLPRIGFLSIAAPIGSTANPIGAGLNAAFVDGLRELGHVEGRTLLIEWRFAEFKPERLPALAADLVRLGVDVIVVGGPAGIAAARDATREIPVVMVASSSDPVGEGRVAGLARPGGNITGLSAAVSADLLVKALALLKETVGRLSRVALLWDFEPAVFRQTYEGPLRQAAQVLGFALEVVPVRSQADLDRAFAAMRRQGVDGVAAVMGGITFAQRVRIVELARAQRLPTVGLFRSLPEAGGLMSYGPDLRDVYRRAAGYVDRILKGARPADLPVEQPARFELVVNLRTARALGLTIPPAVATQAVEVLQ